jgi:hypothetical protein
MAARIAPLRESWVFGNFGLRFLRRNHVVSILLCCLLLYLLYPRVSNDSSSLLSSAQGHLGIKHPIELLHERAELEFEALLSRQSSTAKDAEAEYKRRYGRTPPPGFSDWARYALAARSPIIDDYDVIEKALGPFYDISPKQFTTLMHKAAIELDIPTQHGMGRVIGLCQFKDGQIQGTETCRLPTWLEHIQDSLGNAGRNIPDMEFVMSYLGEGAVLPINTSVADMVWEDRHGRSVAPEVKAACDLLAQTAAEPTDLQKLQKLASRPRPIDTMGVPFVQDVYDARDVCAHPELTDMHGLYAAPASANHVNVRAPVLSVSKAHPFADVILPSHQYVWKENLFDPASDRAWDEKRKVAYWTGASTGSTATMDERSWRNAHRQRFAARFGPLWHPEAEPQRTYTYLRRSSHLGTWEPYQSADLDADKFYVGLTSLHNCEDGGCAAEQEYFHLLDPDPRSRPFDHRFVFDIDGNSYTNRYYRLLASASAVLKATLFSEWHDDRLIPWLHYLPVSLSYDEVPEMVRFLTTTEEGDRVGRRVARAGAEWHDRALTQLHQGVYVYRLFLELAWLQNPARIEGV